MMPVGTTQRVVTPWGNWTILAEGEHTVVKLITVSPGCMLSLQYHTRRDELWQPLGDGLVAYLAPGRLGSRDSTTRALLLEAGSTYGIPRGEVHRLINPTARPVSLLETIIGTYDEGDIARLHDAYGRT